jgi:hypothetical protein
MRAILVDAVESRQLATWCGLTIIADDADATLLAAQFPDDLHPETTDVPADGGTISFAAWLCVTHRPVEEGS